MAVNVYRGRGQFTGRGALDDSRLRVLTPEPGDAHFAHVSQIIQEQSSISSRVADQKRKRRASA